MMNQPMMPEQNNSAERRAMEQSQSRQDSSVPYPSIPNDTMSSGQNWGCMTMPRTPICHPIMQGFPAPYTCEDMLPMGGDWVMPFASMSQMPMPCRPMCPFLCQPWGMAQMPSMQGRQEMTGMQNMNPMQNQNMMPQNRPMNPDGTPFCNGECMQ